MSYGHPDPYYQPEHFGLRIVATLDDPEACYSFDYLVVWQHEDGRLFYASDAGCSCPSPFEDYRSLDDLVQITAENWDAFEASVLDHCCHYSRHHDGDAAFLADKHEMIRRTRALFSAEQRIAKVA